MIGYTALAVCSVVLFCFPPDLWKNFQRALASGDMAATIEQVIENLRTSNPLGARSMDLVHGRPWTEWRGIIARTMPGAGLPVTEHRLIFSYALCQIDSMPLAIIISTTMIYTAARK